MSDLVHFSFQAEFAIDAAHRLIDSYKAWRVRQNQRAAELFSYSCLAFGREINPASLSFDELKDSKISIDDPLKGESLAGLIESYLAIISTLGWQSAIGQDSSLIKYSGVLYSTIGPLIDGFCECLQLAEKAISYIEANDSSIGAASEPGDAKSSELEGSENSITPKATVSRTQDELDEIAGRIHSLLIATCRRSGRKPTYDALADQFGVSKKTIQRWLTYEDRKYSLVFTGCRTLWKNWDSYNPGSLAGVSISRNGRVSKTKQVSRAIDDDFGDDLD